MASNSRTSKPEGRAATRVPSNRRGKLPTKIQNQVTTTREAVVQSSAQKKNQRPNAQIASVPPPEKCAANPTEGKQFNEASAQISSSLQTNQPSRLSVPAAKATNSQVPEDVRAAFATDDIFLLLPLLTQLKLSSFLGHEGDLRTHKGNHLYVVGAMQSIGPRDGLETLLAIQMVATYSAAMDSFAMANHKDQTELGKEMLLNRALKITRTFTMQMEALKKHRSNGEQHCAVEHVHVHSGGQAVVGTINQGGTKESNAAEEGRKKQDEEK